MDLLINNTKIIKLDIENNEYNFEEKFEEKFEKKIEENKKDNIKRIIINIENIEELNKKTKKEKKQKEKKIKISSLNWGLTEYELSYNFQLNLLNQIFVNLNNNKNIELEKEIEFSENIEYFSKTNKTNKTKTKTENLFINCLKIKLQSYKHQDILKNKFNKNNFIKIKDLIILLKNSELKCFYCNCELFIFYELVRENKQWTLDRINNDLGHNNNNLLISCLECNLKRRRINCDNFNFSQNMIIIKTNNNENNENNNEDNKEQEKFDTLKVIKIINNDEFN